MIRILRNNIIFILGLGIPAIFVFRAFFTGSPLVWGDAPYFYPEALTKLFDQPFVWTSWGQNFGGVNQSLWLYPLMLLYGVLHKFLGLGNDAIIRIIFYFPAVLLALISPIFLARYLGFSKVVQFFSSLLYTFNTYFILLVDGGQVGVALAFGGFPLLVLYLRKLIDHPQLVNFSFALLVFILTSMADFRIGTIALIAIVLWILIEGIVNKNISYIKNFIFLLPFVLTVVTIFAYWILPAIKNNLTEGINVSGLQFLSLLNPLLLFQPHFPDNIFGKISSPPFYFGLVPLLLFGGWILKKEKKLLIYILCFLLFTFLVKGDAPPFGEYYRWLTERVPFVAFRDSTKFFAPLLIFGGILIGTTAEKLKPRILAISLVFGYLIFLIYPALLGELNGVLSSRKFPSDLVIIYDKLKKDPGLFRTVWFPERHPLGFHTEEKPALDAKKLIDKRPFAALNVGTYDVFNFMHDSQFLDWFNLLGIKYLVFPGDPRNQQLSIDEQKDWDDLLKLTVITSGLVKQDWPTTFPVYQNPNVHPKIFSVDKLFLVVGGDDIYQKIKEVSAEFAIGNQGFVFFEDGKFDPNYNAFPDDSAVLIFNNSNENDLAMSFLQQYFISPAAAKSSQWAVMGSDKYLKWKFELLIRGINIKDFDYGKGIAFSSVSGEKIRFSFDVPQNGDYVLAVRELLDNGRFGWKMEQISLKNGSWDKEIINTSNVKVINTVVLIPQKVWETAKEQADGLVKRHRVAKIDGQNDVEKLTQLSTLSQWHTIDYQEVNPTEFKISLPKENSWVILTDSFSQGWHIKTSKYYNSSLPVYSGFNGFLSVGDDKSAKIYFSGQESVKWGGYFSLISFFSLAILVFWLYFKKR